LLTLPFIGRFSHVRCLGYNLFFLFFPYHQTKPNQYAWVIPWWWCKRVRCWNLIQNYFHRTVVFHHITWPFLVYVPFLFTLLYPSFYDHYLDTLYSFDYWFHKVWMSYGYVILIHFEEMLAIGLLSMGIYLYLTYDIFINWKWDLSLNYYGVK